MIRLEKLSKTYGSNQILSDIDSHFPKGKISGIVGENGAGKSTMFRCIAGLESYEGKINFTEKSNEQKIGILPTHPFMLSRITGREYLNFLCQARKIHNPNITEQNIFELPLDEYAENYSTGMKKKLALLGILLQQNEIYLLDEPFNGLDLQSNIMVKSLIQELSRRDKTIIISSHVFQSLFELCDNISYLKNGQVQRFDDKNKFQEIEKDMLKDQFVYKMGLLFDDSNQ